MKKLKLLIFTLLICYGVMSAQTFHTIAIDGTNDFKTTTEKFSTTSNADLSAYVTWDDDYLYFAYKGNSVSGGVTDNERVYHLYIDTDPQANPTTGTGTTAGESWRYNPTLPITANYHYAFKTVDNTEYKRRYNGSAWGDQGFETGNYKNTTDKYWEAKIKLADIGNPSKILFVAYVEEDWPGGNICGGVPSGLFTNTNTGGAITFQSAYSGFELIQGILPNANYNLNNSTFEGWNIKISASVGTLSDNFNYAGMGYCGTDSFDTLIDLPKPSAPPSDYIQVYFPHNDWSSVLGPLYSKDIKKLVSLNSTVSIWNFKVNTDKTNQNVTLTFADFSAIPASYEIKVKDLSTNLTQDIRTASTYTYNSGAGGEKSFQLIVGINAVQNISVNPTTLAYGTVLINTTSQKNVKVYNIGNANLSISNITSSNAAFTFTGGTTYTVVPNDSVTIPVTFSPTAATSYSGTLAITSDDPDQGTINVSLTGTGYQTASNISTNLSTIQFGEVLVGDGLTKNLKVYNTGDGNLSITNIVSSNAVFTFTGGTTYTVVPNDSVTIPVQFAPTAETAYTETLTITSNDPDQGSLVVALKGTGTMLHPALSVNPTSLDYGNVPVGMYVNKTIVVTNNGQAALNITNITTEHAYYTYSGSTTITLLPTQNTTLTVRFRPQLATDLNSKLIIVSNDPTNPTKQVDLLGHGTVSNVENKFYAGWNLFSSPVNPTNPIASSVIGGDINPYYLFVYDNSNGYVAEDSVLAGNGYWLGIEDSVNLTISGLGVSDSTQKSLVKGWNLVSSPFLTKYAKANLHFIKGTAYVTPTEAVTRGWIQNAYYGYSNTTKAYDLSDTLKTWKGYWFASLTDGLKMSFDLFNTSKEVKSNNKKALEPSIDDWKVNIIASTEDATDNLLTFGVNAAATDGFDAAFDLAEPPISPANNSVATYFVNTELNPQFTKYAEDIRKPFSGYGNQGNSWMVNVVSRKAGLVTLKWGNLAELVPEELRNIFTFSLSGGGITGFVNMVSTQEHTIQAEANRVYEFGIGVHIVGVDDETNNDFSYALEQNYPNPFNPSTIISYSVPEQTYVSIKVYDILGHEVTTLVNKEVNAGRYQITFDASKVSGGLSSGVYFYTIKAGNFVATKKLLLTK